MSTTAPLPSRRTLLRGAGGASIAAASGAVLADPADASEKRRKKKKYYRPGRFAATPLLSVQERHLANRFSYGITAELADEIRSAGGHLAWFEQQLATAYDGSADNLCDWWPDLHRDALDLYQRNASRTRAGWEVMADYGRRSLIRRVTSPRQVLEVMTEFWENHFHVPANADNVYTFRAEYGELIRQHALGRVEDLLRAAVLHPAMTFYLGAYASTKLHPNENLGRELLELHTVGLGNYTEDDVKNSARILTGYRIDAYKTWAVSYQPSVHWTGPVQVMGFSDPNTDADGQAVTGRYLSYLAHHPAMARRIATKLGRYFVSDDPPESLITRLAAIYLDHDTAIVPVLQALVRSAEFGAAVDLKVRDADEDIIAAYRLLGVEIAEPISASSAANLINWQVSALGLAPFSWPRPDGQPVDNASWATPSRALASMAQHWGLVGGWWPKEAVSYPTPSSWMPRRGNLLFRDLVDHLSRLLLHRESTEDLLRACCLAVELEPTTLVSPSSDLFRWRWPRLAAAIVDSPDFYVR
ncbi:DUF1800 domain-containing protein [Nocardioides mangrovi]|uniref:DUF1800 domain-containing protein n=1 Tax=Nocardioides mangrovi TaxID=2874580 RepID=A0ABS7UCX0_9ACTN|nr:DUF1800 domain-containing protein [Nocardioides mangrovi]MBZ5738508.1 DUF1800 domain-containing protein [Nocardioides mangrovi]